MDDKSLLTILRKILTQPTAPFHEYSVRAAISKLLENLPDVQLATDPFGNLLATYNGSSSTPKWAFSSHMDHPGWVREIEGALEPDELRQRDGFRFLGGVPDSYFSQDVPIKSYGDFAMWDVTEFKRENGFISSRACDDLVGCASIVATLIDLQKKNSPTSCVGIFTRAEEVGFVGAVELAKTWSLGDDCVFVSVETSIPTDGARMGSGPVCRVGDRQSIFDSQATATLLEIAKENAIPAQRALLDRGSCEATALQTFGITTTGISVPLGNYHNCSEGNQIKAEYVNFADVKNLVALLTATAAGAPDGPRETLTCQRERLEARAARYQAYAAASTEKFT